MTQNETPTPRTDALICAPNGNYFSASAEDFRNLARQLERELAEAKAELKELWLSKTSWANATQALNQQLSAAVAERERLKELLADIRSSNQTVLEAENRELREELSRHGKCNICNGECDSFAANPRLWAGIAHDDCIRNLQTSIIGLREALQEVCEHVGSFAFVEKALSTSPADFRKDWVKREVLEKLNESAAKFLTIRTIDPCDPFRQVAPLPIANRSFHETMQAAEELREALTLAQKELDVSS